MEKFYKTSEVAKMLGINQRTFQRMVKYGKIIPAKITNSGYGLFTSDQIVQLLTQAQEKSHQTFIDNCDKKDENRATATDKIATTATKTATTAQTKMKIDKYNLWITRRRELAEQAKPFLPNLLYELGVTNLSKNFHCINPAHSDSTPSMTYYADTHCVHCHGCGFHGNIFNPHHADHTPSVTYYADTQTVHCHGCGFHGNIFQVYAAAYNKTIDKALFDGHQYRYC